MVRLSSFRGPFHPVVQAAPPHIASINAVVNYFRGKYPSKAQEEKRKQLCQDAYQCQAWSVEPELMQDLIEARLTDDPEKTKLIRSCLRAVSWQDHTQKTTPELTAILHHLKQELAHESHMAKRINDDEAEGFREQMEEIGTIIAALELGKRGTEAEAASEAIEDILWNHYREYRIIEEQLKQAINQGWNSDTMRTQRLQALRSRFVDRILHLRSIRDQLYFQAMYDGWYISTPIKQTA